MSPGHVNNNKLAPSLGRAEVAHHHQPSYQPRQNPYSWKTIWGTKDFPRTFKNRVGLSYCKFGSICCRAVAGIVWIIRVVLGGENLNWQTVFSMFWWYNRNLMPVNCMFRHFSVNWKPSSVNYNDLNWLLIFFGVPKRIINWLTDCHRLKRGAIRGSEDPYQSVAPLSSPRQAFSICGNTPNRGTRPRHLLALC